MRDDYKSIYDFNDLGSQINRTLMTGDGDGKRDQLPVLFEAMRLWLNGKLGLVMSSEGKMNLETGEDPLLQAPREVIASLLKNPQKGECMSFVRWQRLLPLGSCSTGIRSRILNCLDGNPMFGSMRDLVSTSRKEVLAHKNLGQKCMAAFETALREYGLSFGLSLADLDKRLQKAAANF